MSNTERDYWIGHGRRWRVYSTYDRGAAAEGPRFVRSACHSCPVDGDEAERLAAAERAKPYITKVEVVEI